MNNNKSFVIALALILALIKVSNGYAITNSAQQKIILGKHNEVRSLSANGKMSQYGFQTAAKLYPLTWDNTLANTAERLASSCSRGHNTFGTGNGQNIAWGAGGYASPGVGVPNEQPQGTGFCSNCFASDDEAIKFLQYSWISGSNEQSEGPDATTHFTQMVDDDTFKVGCAVNPNCNNEWYLVCNYDPAGNDVGTPVYETGATGSKCPNGQSNGLCSGLPQPSGSGDGNGNGNGSGNGNGNGSGSGSGGSSTNIDINKKAAELCAGSNGSSVATSTTCVNNDCHCVHTITCNNGKSETIKQAC